jgi:acetyl esterase/lipase
MSALAADVVGRGWAAWNIEYRRLGTPRRGGWPTTFEDVGAAIDHLGTLARDHPLDPSRVVSVGHSAGGHLALWAAARPGLPASSPGSPTPSFVAVTGAVALAPVADLEEAARFRVGRGSVERLLGGSPVERPERYRLASPAARLPLGVPQVVVHGDRDEAVPVELSRRYVARARAAGDEATFVELAGVGHMELIDPTSTAWAATLPYLRPLLA